MKLKLNAVVGRHRVIGGAFRTLAIVSAASSTLVLGGASPARADTVGNIQVCYRCNFFLLQDGPIFEISTTSFVSITSATFTAAGDTFNIGTIAAGASFLLLPGISSDGSSHTGFWQVTGTIRDTSEVGPNLNDTQFSFTGLEGGLTVASGIFTPASSIQELSNDGRFANINFLGGPGNNDDGTCNDCYGPNIVATISTAAVPGPIAGAGLPGASGGGWLGQ